MRRIPATPILTDFYWEKPKTRYQVVYVNDDTEERFWDRLGFIVWPDDVYDVENKLGLSRFVDDPWYAEFKHIYKQKYALLYMILSVWNPKLVEEKKEKLKAIVSNAIALGKDRYYEIVHNPELYRDDIIQKRYVSFYDKIYHWVK